MGEVGAGLPLQSRNERMTSRSAEKAVGAEGTRLACERGLALAQTGGAGLVL